MLEPNSNFLQERALWTLADHLCVADGEQVNLVPYQKDFVVSFSGNGEIEKTPTDVKYVDDFDNERRMTCECVEV